MVMGFEPFSVEPENSEKGQNESQGAPDRDSDDFAVCQSKCLHTAWKRNSES